MDEDNQMLLADGFEEALLGVTRGQGGGSEVIAVYSSDRCIDVLVAGGMELMEAVEYFDFNVVSAYVGERTPLFVDEVTMPELMMHIEENDE